MGGVVENARSTEEKKKTSKKEVKTSRAMEVLVEALGIADEQVQLQYGRVVMAFDRDHWGYRSACQVISNLSMLCPDLLASGELQLALLQTPTNENGHSTTSLGTITPAATELFFEEVSEGHHLVPVEYQQARDNPVIDKAFGQSEKAKSERKKWIASEQKRQLKEGAPELCLNEGAISVEHLFEVELSKHFIAENQSRLPSLFDGLSPCRRAVIYTFKCDKIKPKHVKQMSGVVAAFCDVPQQGLEDAIISMSKKGTTSLIKIKDQKGDSYQTSGRYLPVTLSPVARLILPAVRDALLPTDKHRVEPRYYLPIIPLLLANGVTAVCAGLRMTIYPYCPISLVMNVKRKLAGEEMVLMKCKGPLSPKIVAMDANNCARQFTSVKSMFDCWYDQSLQLLCQSGSTEKEVKEKWQMQLDELLVQLDSSEQEQEQEQEQSEGESEGEGEGESEEQGKRQQHEQGEGQQQEQQQLHPLTTTITLVLDDEPLDETEKISGDGGYGFETSTFDNSSAVTTVKENDKGKKKENSSSKSDSKNESISCNKKKGSSQITLNTFFRHIGEGYFGWLKRSKNAQGEYVVHLQLDPEQLVVLSTSELFYLCKTATSCSLEWREQWKNVQWADYSNGSINVQIKAGKNCTSYERTILCSPKVNHHQVSKIVEKICRLIPLRQTEQQQQQSSTSARTFNRGEKRDNSSSENLGQKRSKA